MDRRELARLLGGEIRLSSVPGEGSSFTLYLPLTYSPPKPSRQRNTMNLDAPPSVAAAEANARNEATEATTADSAARFDDDRDRINPGDRSLLIIENDESFARFLVDMARESGFKAVVASRGSDAMLAARELQPTAITLDINLPDIDGWRILSRLKDDSALRHVPVYVISTEEERERGLRLGAIGALRKPVESKEILDETFARIKLFVDTARRRLLLVDPHEESRQQTIALLSDPELDILSASTPQEAIERILETQVDAAVITIHPGDRTAIEAAERIRREGPNAELPMLLYSSGSLTKKEIAELKHLAQTAITRDVRSPERLLDDTMLVLHRRMDALPPEKRNTIDQLHQAAPVLAGRKVLVVDDDIRNIYAMASVLERLEMQVISADDGKSAVETLKNTPDVDVVLMDIMMPELDGYETMRTIRKLARFRSLPIIALTAKAMKGDREKCLEAGASDYIAKPVDTEQLLGLLRLWLHR